jgi:hypothetical protein
MNIISNGSGAVYPLQSLMERLATETLDPRFEKHGNFVSTTRNTVKVHGNFLSYSHVFDIEGDAEEMQPIVNAIRAAQQRGDYRAARVRMSKHLGAVRS